MSGDKKSLAILVKRWHKAFCDKAYWLVKDKDVAKDIAQESWSTIIDKLENLNDPKRFKYWALRIVCNKSTDWLRLQTKQQKRTVDYVGDIENNQSQSIENEGLKKALLAAINELSNNQRMIIQLFYIENYSLKQISELLEISVGTAKSRLFYAREKLKKNFKK